ncbi:hypothetical protein Aph02nite_83540 [Actinoplanes philippinensis]|nr:hypothetical protein Aph02nite_83540 [Actinoplanes philippinensis]
MSNGPRRESTASSKAWARAKGTGATEPDLPETTTATVSSGSVMAIRRIHGRGSRATATMAAPAAAVPNPEEFEIPRMKASVPAATWYGSGLRGAARDDIL